MAASDRGGGRPHDAVRRATTPSASPGGAGAISRARRQCGLCGKTRKLTRTECCGQWICDDEDQYVLFSYARNSCSRNHRRFTLCGYHAAEGHPGSWKTCRKCRDGFETELYVYYGTNEYNVDRLPNPPAYRPTRCSRCRAVIVLSADGYSMTGREYRCERCTAAEMDDLFGRRRPPGRPRKPRS